MRMTIYGLAMVLCTFAVFGGCSEQTEKDPMMDIRTSGVSKRMVDHIDMVLKRAKPRMSRRVMSLTTSQWSQTGL